MNSGRLFLAGYSRKEGIASLNVEFIIMQEDLVTEQIYTLAV